MSGIYIHIPFCRQACHYCDFHFSTSLKNKGSFLEALKKEIYLQSNYLAPSPCLPAGTASGKVGVGSVYFGGGTPSILSKIEILDIFDELSKYFVIDANAEITLEANPDDLSKEKLRELSQTPVNRLSIGLQSFFDKDLKFLNRIHNSKEAVESVRNAKDIGFKNISIDLIYGIQTLTNKQWRKNLERAFELNVQHVSCYSLTVEPRTALHSFIQKGKIKNIDSKKSAEQFEIVMDEMEKNKFIHYEISNFCKEGFYSKHNSNYWRGINYLGLGPSAHSFNGDSRQWNVKSNSAYINSLNKNIIPFEKETLSENQKYNEYVMTSLRTMWGINTDFILKYFGKKYLNHLLASSERYIMLRKIKTLPNMDCKGGASLCLTPKGKLFADKIAGDLFMV